MLDEKYKGMILGCMPEDVKAELMQIVGDQRCMIAVYDREEDCVAWNSMGLLRSPHKAYWPTKEQFAVEQARYKEDTIWLYKPTMDVSKITGANRPDFEYTILYSHADVGCLVNGFFQLGSNLDQHSIPFYAPPPQGELDARGLEIDCIRRFKVGDIVFGIGGFIELCTTPALGRVIYDGYRYILKKKQPKLAPQPECDEVVVPIRWNDDHVAFHASGESSTHSLSEKMGFFSHDGREYRIVGFIFNRTKPDGRIEEYPQPIMWMVDNRALLLKVRPMALSCEPIYASKVRGLRFNKGDG